MSPTLYPDIVLLKAVAARQVDCPCRTRYYGKSQPVTMEGNVRPHVGDDSVEYRGYGQSFGDKHSSAVTGTNTPDSARQLGTAA
jgi:hypothetical protein